MEIGEIGHGEFAQDDKPLSYGEVRIVYSIRYGAVPTRTIFITCQSLQPQVRQPQRSTDMPPSIVKAGPHLTHRMMLTAFILIETAS